MAYRIESGRSAQRYLNGLSHRKRNAFKLKAQELADALANSPPRLIGSVTLTDPVYDIYLFRFSYGKVQYFISFVCNASEENLTVLRCGEYDKWYREQLSLENLRRRFE